MLFYESILVSLMAFLISPMFIKTYTEYKCRRRKEDLQEQFKDALYSISASVASGRSMPKAISDAATQASMFFGKESMISVELTYINEMYETMHFKTEDLLVDFAIRSDLDEIKLFAESYRICKLKGGSLEDICLKSAYLLIERIDYQKEVSAVLSEKKLDTLIMMAITPAILFFLNMTSYDYIAILYGTSEGRIIMTVSLLLMMLSALWSLKMMNLKL